MRKSVTLRIAAALMISALCAALAACGKGNALDPREPVTLTLWHTYGEQADSPMNRLVQEFNETVGLQKGIIIDVALMSNSSTIGEQLLAAQADKPGSQEMPDLFFCYPSTADALGSEQLVDWNECFAPEELQDYVGSFLEEGMIDGRLTVFPVSKSTRLLFVNGTEFGRFSEATGVSYEDLDDWNGFFDTAEKYYAWSGGKAFCAFDYIIQNIDFCARSKDPGIWSEDGWYDTDNAVLHDTWMRFAEALVKGHIVISELYSNTQVMTGDVPAGVGSSAAILYYNDVVTYPDNTSEPTDLHVFPLPEGEGTRLAPQTGAGLCALRTTERRQEAAEVFVRWLTEGERNLVFCAETGYMPVSNAVFASMEGYEFKDPGYAAVFRALKRVWEKDELLALPSDAGYIEKTNAVYDRLKVLQREFPARLRAGESAGELAEETWELFRSFS